MLILQFYFSEREREGELAILKLENEYVGLKKGRVLKYS